MALLDPAPQKDVEDCFSSPNTNQHLSTADHVQHNSLQRYSVVGAPGQAHSWGSSRGAHDVRALRQLTSVNLADN
jgi:hypothetical protein